MRLRFQAALFFVATLGLLALVSFHLCSYGYENSAGLQRWAEATTVIDTTEDVAQALTRSFPWLSFLCLATFRAITGALPVWLPVGISCLAGAAVLTVFHLDLRHNNSGLLRSTVVPLALLLHPLFLWPVTSGDSLALVLLVFLTLTRVAMRIAREIDARALMSMAAISCLLLFTDGRSVYVLLALFALTALLLPRQMGPDSAVGGYIIVFLPLAMALCGCVYVGWVATGDPLFLYRTALGANAPHQVGDWWSAYSPGFFTAPLLIAFVSLVCFPCVCFRVRAVSSFNWTAQDRAAITMLAAAAIATAISQADGALPHPAAMLFYGVAPWICLLSLRPKQALYWLVPGAASAWLLFLWLPTADMQSWATALAGSTQRNTVNKTAELGRWLAKQPGVIMADDRFLAAALAERGHARDVVVPGSASFRLMIRQGAPTADWVVMNDPHSETWGQDRVAQRYARGLPGYELAWRNTEWCVFQKLRGSPAGDVLTLSSIGNKTQ